MTKTIIETKRLRLRPFTLLDVEPFSEICADENVMRYIGGGAHDVAKTRENIISWISHFEQKGFGLMALIHKEDNKLVGFCGLMPQTVDGKDYIELGYRLAQDYWGKGLATESAQAVRAYAFNELGLNELISIIHHENIQSMKVAKNVGMNLLTKTQFHGVSVDIYHLLKQRT